MAAKGGASWCAVAGEERVRWSVGNRTRSENGAHFYVDATLAPAREGAAVQAGLTRLVVKVAFTEPFRAVIDSKQSEEQVAEEGSGPVELDAEFVGQRVAR